MHSRDLRRLELGRVAPRRVLHVGQKHGANGVIEAVSGKTVAANMVLTGFLYQHGSTAGGPGRSAQFGIHPTELSGIQATMPVLATALIPPYGSAVFGPDWSETDRAMLKHAGRQSTPLRNAPGYYIHVWQGLTFAGSHSTVTLRPALDSDAFPFTITRPPPAPAPPPTPPSSPPPAFRPRPPRGGTIPPPTGPVAKAGAWTHATYLTARTK